MSKITYIGGDLIEEIGGSYKLYSDGGFDLSTQKQLVFNAKEGNICKEPSFVKPINDIDKEGPGLVMRSAKKKGRNPKDTATAADLLYGDYPENAIGLEKLRKEISDLEFTDCKDRKEANEFAKSRIDNLKSYLELPNEKLFAIFENDIKSWSRNDLEDVAVDIVEKMKKNTGGIVSYKALTSAAKNHASFVEFANITESCIKDYTYKKNKINDLGITMATKADEGKLYNAILEQKAKPPLFNTVHDTINGLRILVNGVWAYEVRILRYRKQYMSLFIELEYTLYDHFGLDAPDIHKFDKEIFYVWFILQHFRGFKPLITQMKINREYPMIVPVNWK